MSTRIENVVLYGDSVTNGLHAPGNYGWGRMLRDHYFALNDTPDDYVANFHDLTARGEWSVTFDKRTKATTDYDLFWYREHRPALSVVQVGAQDLYMNLRNRRNPLECDPFRRHFSVAIGRLLERGDVLYVGIPAPEEQKVFAVIDNGPLVKDVLILYEMTASFIVRQMAECAGRECEVVSLFNESQRAEDYSISTNDHVHPDAAGHKWIYERVCPVFDDMVGKYDRSAS